MCSAPRHEDDGGTEQLPTMEAHLRKLYMKVHPDLFVAHPEARAENEKSFQLLSEFLGAVKNPDAGRGGVGKVFQLTFHLRPAAQPGEGGEGGAALEQVTVSLRSDGSPREKKKQLGKLFEACGITGDFSFSAAGSSGRGARDSGPASDLEHFVRDQSQAAALARQEHDRAWRHVYAEQHALQLWHQVRVSFVGASATWEPDARAALLKQLRSEKVLAVLQVDCSRDQDSGLRASQHVLIGDCNSIYMDGRITLDAQAPETWTRHIQSMDWSRAAAAESRLREIRGLERAAAQCLGLSFVHGASVQIELSRAYTGFLNGISSMCQKTNFAAHKPKRAATSNADEPPALLPRPVLLVDSTEVNCSRPSLVKHFDGCALDTSRGILIANVAAPLQNVLSLVQTYGHEAGECRAQFDAQRKALSVLLAEAKMCLGLASLEVDWDAGVADEEVTVHIGCWAAREKKRERSARVRAMRVKALVIAAVVCVRVRVCARANVCVCVFVRAGVYVCVAVYPAVVLVPPAPTCFFLWQALACCSKLIAAAGSLLPPKGLAPLTQGLHLCIGVRYGVRPDGSMTLPHDLDLHP
jgi:hypothetical protein